MKKTAPLLTLICLSLILLSIYSCKKDSDTTNNTNTNTTTDTDPNLHGKILSSAWVYNSGTASNDYSDSTHMYLTLYADTFADPCNSSNNIYNSAYFSILKKVGTYSIGGSFDSDIWMVIFTDPNWSSFVDISSGTVKITSIDSSSISGYIDVTFDANNYIKGNFTVNACFQ